MEKLSINYQPGQCKAIIVDKEAITPEPWPMDPVPDDADPENLGSVVVHFDIKLSKEKMMMLKRTLRKFSKVPRKLKKAAKHIARTKIGETTIEDQDGTLFAKSPLIHYAIEKGYPHNKWARKSLRLIEWAVINYIKAL